MNLFINIERRISETAMWLAIVFIVLAACLAIYQVTTRFVFGHPSTWSEVITRSTMIWAVFIGVAPAYRHGAMIAIDVIQAALPRRAGVALFQVANLLSLVFFAVLFWQGWGMTERVVNQKLAGLQISIAWVYAALPVGAVFAMVAIMGRLARVAASGALDSKPAEESL